MNYTNTAILALSLVATGCVEEPKQHPQAYTVAKQPTRKNSKAYRDFWTICMWEGRGVINCNAINVYEGARGPAQITKVFLVDSNEWLANHGMKTYSHEDMHDPAKAFIICQAYWRRYKLTTTEERCRAHCSGPDGPYQDNSLPYWEGCKQYL